MSETIRWTYNKVFAYLILIPFSIFLVIFVRRTFQLDDPRQITIMRFADFLLLGFIIIVCIKYFIPALTGQIALELNDDCLIDNVRKRKVYWDNVQNIRQVTLGKSAGIAIDLIDNDIFYGDQNVWQKALGRISNFNYGTPMVIPLQYISGDNDQIFQALKEYADARKKVA